MAALHGSLTALALCFCVAGAAAQESGNTRSEPTRAGLGEVEAFESDWFNLNRATNSMTYTGFRVFGENWSLSADEAHVSTDARNFESGQWRFSGNIDLQLDTASLAASSATFVFRNQQIQSVELTGEPVAFEDRSSYEDEPVQGTATTIRYDDAAQTFELLGAVSLTVGPYRTTGCDLIYYLGQEEFTTGSSQCSEPFRTVITPQESSETTAD